MCGEKGNVTAHVFTDHWYSNSYACGGKASTRTCSCGYSYKYVPQHVQDDTIYSDTYSVDVHHKVCKNCGAWTWHEDCCNKNGSLSCKNPGKCSICGGVWPENRHFINSSGGICNNCHQRFYTITNIRKDYSSDYKSVDVSFTIKPVNSTVKITGNIMFDGEDANVASCTGNIIQNLDNTTTIKWHLNLMETKPTAISIPCWRYDNIKVNGQASYVCEPITRIWLDHTAPTISEIKQTDQQSHNGYATIKQLDISGTEDYANVVKLSIIDKETGKKLVDKATTAVTDNKWSYTCTPPLEANDSGRTYIVQVEDVNNNVSSKEFTIYKTDGTAPQIESPLSYTDWTNTAKTVTLTFTDYGSGDVQASLGDQAHYQACTKTADGKYQITYTFNDDIIGNKTYKLYLRDGLGNTDDYDLIIGNIDKNTYNISYNLNGGAMNGQKTSYTVADSFTLPTPTKTGYTFTGWTGSNGTTLQKTVTINKGTRGNLNYTANWQINQYAFDLNSYLDSNFVSDGNLGNFGTVDFYINGVKVLDDVNDICITINYGSTWEIKDIKAKAGYTYQGAEGGDSVLKGIIGAYKTEVRLKYTSNPYVATFYPNGGTLVSCDKYLTVNADKTVSFKTLFGYNNFYILGLTAKRDGYLFTGFYDKVNGGNMVWNSGGQYGAGVCTDNSGIYWKKDPFSEGYLWSYPGNASFYAHWTPITYTIKYDGNGSNEGEMGDSVHVYNNYVHISANAYKKTGWSFKGWNATREYNGKTQCLYTPDDVKYKWYNKNEQPNGYHLYLYKNEEMTGRATTINNDVITLHAQWKYVPIQVKIPQVIIGSEKGASQFRVKCDDFKAGSIKVTVPNSFPYKQTGKADVTATITAKSGNNIITPYNKVCVYNVTAKNGLSAGCWQGSFNIGLTLTKE